MPELDNDRLEHFFRKAAAKADVSFNEADWVEMERRLDAVDATRALAGKKAAGRWTLTLVVGLLVSGAVWLTYELAGPSDITSISEIVESNSAVAPSVEHALTPLPQEMTVQPATEGSSGTEKTPKNFESDSRPLDVLDVVQQPPTSSPRGDDPVVSGVVDGVSQGDESSLSQELSRILPDDPERNKQKAVVELPGAEEEETREARTMVHEEHAAEREKHVAAPRLSLLLSYAPDFSGVSMGLSSTPGNAFGAVLHYHLTSRWSFSAGAIRNYKVYSAAGEEYSPPKGYWKYYTNGVIPETIDGSCSILEFPLMIQYAAIETPTSRVNVAVGASSYLMQSESYRYHFADPNPGSRDGWDSRGSSRFLFNMLNLSVGYERQIAPRLMLGIEPYAKIPVEKIGWSNLKLFSSGAAFTLRYTLVQRKNAPIAARSRPPN